MGFLEVQRQLKKTPLSKCNHCGLLDHCKPIIDDGLTKLVCLQCRTTIYNKLRHLRRKNGFQVGRR